MSNLELYKNAYVESFEIEIDGVVYTLCYKEPSTCRNKIPVCFHANFIQTISNIL